MAAAQERDEQNAIRVLLIHINEAWVQGRAEELAQHFHESMVIRGADHKLLASGREACVASYVEFVKKATVHAFRQTEPPEVDVAGNTAITTYRWEIEYEIKGRAHKESGRDVFAFVREHEQDRWQAIWRLVQFAPKRSRVRKK